MSDREEFEMSPEERELAERGKALIAEAVSQVEAPHSLRESIEREREQSQVRDRAAPPWWRRGRSLAAALGAVAAVVLGIVAFTGSEGGEPSQEGLEAVASLAPRAPAPRPAGGDPPVLAAKVGPIAFPDWRQSFGWTAVGARQGEVEGRGVTTVYYRNGDGAHLAYAILSGPALDQAPPGQPRVHVGKTYHVSESPQRTVVTWRQQGHTCVIVADASVRPGRLIELAASRNV